MVALGDNKAFEIVGDGAADIVQGHDFRIRPRVRLVTLNPMPLLPEAASPKVYFTSIVMRAGAVQAMTKPDGDPPPLGWSSTSPGAHFVPFLLENSSFPVRFLPIPQ